MRAKPKGRTRCPMCPWAPTVLRSCQPCALECQWFAKPIRPSCPTCPSASDGPMVPFSQPHIDRLHTCKLARSSDSRIVRTFLDENLQGTTTSQCPPLSGPMRRMRSSFLSLAKCFWTALGQIPKAAESPSRDRWGFASRSSISLFLVF